jgi:hypothetical protein
MGTIRILCRRTISAALILAFVVPPLAVAGTSPQEAAAKAQETTAKDGGVQTEPGATEQLPDSPGTVQSPAAKPASTSAVSQVSSGIQPVPAGQQHLAQQPEPAGTAAAGIANTAGIAASKPAGLALAPGRQRRVRMIVIRMGAILGAGAAVGTVVALSKASPSRPPGAH